MPAALLCLAGFQWREARLGGLELLDTTQWYTPEQAAALFGALDRLDSRARAVYAWTEVSIDMVFPVAYGLLFALLLARRLRGRTAVLPAADRGGRGGRLREPRHRVARLDLRRRPEVLDASGGGLHAAEERADPGDAGRGSRRRDSMAVDGATTRVRTCPESSAAAGARGIHRVHRDRDGWAGNVAFDLAAENPFVSQCSHAGRPKASLRDSG